MKACILVVEDDTAMAEGIRDMLELAGYEVMLAANGREGLERLAQHKPDLILNSPTSSNHCSRSTGHNTNNKAQDWGLPSPAPT